MKKSNSESFLSSTKSNPNKKISDYRKIYKKEFNFYQMKNGNKISCHGKPKLKDIEFLKQKFGLNYVLTLLHDKEEPQQIEEFCKKVGDIEWHNLKLTGANMALFMKKDIQEMIVDYIYSLFQELKDNNKVIFIHCAAGVHRTGTILYTILRASGETRESAMEAIKQIRLQTYRNCGENRISYAETFLVSPLIKKMHSEISK